MVSIHHNDFSFVYILSMQRQLGRCQLQITRYMLTLTHCRQGVSSSVMPLVVLLEAEKPESFRTSEHSCTEHLSSRGSAGLRAECVCKSCGGSGQAVSNNATAEEVTPQAGEEGGSGPRPGRAPRKVWIVIGSLSSSHDVMKSVAVPLLATETLG
jgi:hypothetical protein